jgi:hypothetical protein
VQCGSSPRRLIYRGHPITWFFCAFRSNRKYFLIGDTRAAGLYARMRVQTGSARASGKWFTESNQATIALLKKPRARALLGGAHAIIVFGIFVALFAATLVGGRAAIDPMLESAAEEQDSQSKADIVYTMPGGTLCRHMSYDNVTGEQTGGAIRPCDGDILARTHMRPQSHFTWQTNN